MNDELTQGELIDGRYRVVRLIGEGSMGQVYEAEHTGIGKQVALKILHPMFSNVTDMVTRFRREARMATQIGHPHIVDVTDSGMTRDHRFYFVMEYLDGAELGSVIRRRPLEVRRALRVARQIAQALQAAHQAGVIHRDLKPENIILIERDGDLDFVKVVDFGIAWSPEQEGKRRLTQPGITMGTPEYMAPEQAIAHASDARSDVYSLGAILYEMVTGQQPYQGSDYTEILAQKMSAEPRPARELRDDLPEEVDALIRRAMSRDPAARQQSMSDVVYEITTCLEGRAAAVSRLVGMVAPPPIEPFGGKAADRSGPVAAAEGIAPPEVRIEEIALDDGALDPIALEQTVPLPSAVAEETSLVARNPTKVRRPLRPILLLALLVTVVGGAVWYRSAWTKGDRSGSSQGEPAAPALSGSVDGTEAAPAASAPAAKRRSAPAQAQGAAGSPPRNPKQARALMKKALGAMQRRDWGAAQELYDRLARGSALAEWGHIGLARVALATGDPGAAVRHARAGLRGGGGIPARLELARGLAGLDRRSAAAAQYRMILKNQPKNRAARRGMSEVLARQRR